MVNYEPLPAAGRHRVGFVVLQVHGGIAFQPGMLAGKFGHSAELAMGPVGA